jgi:hypothetical protein
VAPARIVSTITAVRKPTSTIRNAAAVVSDLCSRDLPERTVASGGQPADRDDPLVARRLRKGEVHPYVPAAVDVWLRERT